MSLKRFVSTPEVRAKICLLRPKLPRKVAAQLRVEPRSKRYMVIGTAFDYLMRFEIQRQAPHAVPRPWVAEAAVDTIWFRREGRAGWMPLSKDDQGVIRKGAAQPMGIGDEALAREMAGRARKVVDSAKVAVAAHLKRKSPNCSEQADLAAHALRLAKLDDIARARCSDRLDLTFESADEEDVEDLVNMLAVVPTASLFHEKTILLNPTFGESSPLVGGADADLITGDMLVDFKTTKLAEMAAADLDQLLGYFLLARRQHQVDPTFPAINRLAIYFCRHGYLWTLGADTWTSRPEFAEIESWFFDHATRIKEAARSSLHKPRDTDPGAAKRRNEEFREVMQDYRRQAVLDRNAGCPIGELLEEVKRRTALEPPWPEGTMTIGAFLKDLWRRVPQPANCLKVTRAIADVLAERGRNGPKDP